MSTNSSSKRRKKKGSGKDKAANELEWDGTMFGVQLPKPEGYDKVWSNSLTMHHRDVFIAGVTYDEYRAYCQSLEDSPDWMPLDITPRRDTASFPDDYNDTMVVDFQGIYKDTLIVSVLYCSDSLCDANDDMPNFQMVVSQKNDR